MKNHQLAYQKRRRRKEVIIRDILVVLTFFSLLFNALQYTYSIYQNLNIDRINEFLINYIHIPMLVDNFLIYIFATLYIVLGYKSEKEVAIKIIFSIFAILTTMVFQSLFINMIADIFGVL